MSASTAAGSDEFHDFLCQPCEEENDRNEAKGLCQECSEYLCATCIKYHKRDPKNKSHSILIDSQMPKAKVATKSKDSLTEVCPKHTEEVIKFFCGDHECLACSVCVSLDHRTCVDLAYIPNVTSDIQTGPEIHQVQAYLEHLRGVMTMKGDEATSHSKTASKIHIDTAADIKAIRTQLNKYLDDIQANLQQQIDDVQRSEKREFGDEEEKYRSLVKQVDDILNKLEEKKQQGKNKGLFIALKQTRETLSVLALKVQQAPELSKPSSFNIQKDSILKTLKADLIQTWQLKRNTHNTDLKGMDIKHVGDLDVKIESDTETCYISGILVLPDHRIAFTDLDNNVVKLMNPDQNRVIAHISVSSSPYGLALVNDKIMAVTLGDEKVVQMIGYSTNLTSKNHFSVPGTCKGIDCFDENLFILCYDTKTIYIFDVQGVKLREISGYWSMASRITLNEYGEIFITDHTDFSVVHISSDGSEISKYKSHDLTQPIGIVHDPQHHCIFVVGWSSSSVCMLKSSGQFVKTLLREECEFQHPVAVTSRNGKMYVSFDSRTDISNKVKVFELV